MFQYCQLRQLQNPEILKHVHAHIMINQVRLDQDNGMAVLC